MLKITALTTLLSVAGFVLAAKEMDRGSYEVAGLSARKKAILGNSGTTLDMAIAMLETDTMSTDYQLYDGKEGDSANLGIFKQNWGMIRTCCDRFKGLTTEQLTDGLIINTDLAQDIKCRNQCQDYYGYERWFASHRNGANGLKDPHTEDILNYTKAVEWIKEQLESDEKYLRDDTRFWVHVHPI